MGRGVPKDNVRAYLLMDLAAEQGEEGAAEERDRLVFEMTTDQFAEAQRVIREWKPTK
jgi:hypothetical protein